MKAVQVGKPGTAQVADVPEPRLRDPQDAIVKVTAAAICGADLFPLHGMTPGFDPGTVLGHEFTGVITEVGDAVDLPEAGQRVVSSSMTSDGTCTHCRAGRAAQCASRALFGYSGVYPRLDGGQAEYVRVPMADRCLLPLPAAFSDEQALFLADILPTGYAAVQRSGAGLTDTVVGAGLRAGRADGAAMPVRLRRRRDRGRLGGGPAGTRRGVRRGGRPSGRSRGAGPGPDRRARRGRGYRGGRRGGSARRPRCSWPGGAARSRWWGLTSSPTTS